MTRSKRASQLPQRVATDEAPVSKAKVRSTIPHTHSANPKPSSKAAKCVALLSRRSGASISELQAATDWQPHSVRGFLAATIKKKLGLSLTSAISKSGERRYQVAKSGAQT